MKMMIYVLTFAFLVIVGYIFIYKQMPEYSLQQIQQAAEQKDQDKFEKYVDLQLLSNSLARQFVSYISKGPTDELVNRQLEEAVTASSQPQLQPVFKEIVVDYVKYGKYPGQKEVSSYSDTVTPAAMLMRLQDSIVKKLEFQGFNTTSKEDEFATVMANFYMPAQGKTLKLEFTMRDMGKYWQIVEVHNLDRFLKELQ